MKKKILLTLVVLMPFLVQARCNVIQNENACALSKQMHNYFINVLKDTYHLDDKALLWEKFCSSYNQKVKEALSNHKIDPKGLRLDLEIDRKELERINTILFKRTTDYYYYFFPECICETLEAGKGLDWVTLVVIRSILG